MLLHKFYSEKVEFQQWNYKILFSLAPTEINSDPINSELA